MSAYKTQMSSFRPKSRPILLSEEVLRPAAEELLREYGEFYAMEPKVSNSAQGVLRDRIARQVTVLAQHQSSTVLALLAHIAWYFNSQYGLPKGIVDPNFEYQSPSEVLEFFQAFKKSRSLSPKMCCHLFEKSELMEWAGTGNQEMFERKAVFKRKVEDVIWSLGSSLLLALKMEDGKSC